MHIISASRRTDIPAFYMDWFMNRLDAGSATYPNPFSKQMHTVSLQPDDVHTWHIRTHESPVHPPSHLRRRGRQHCRIVHRRDRCPPLVSPFWQVRHFRMWG